MQQEFNNNVKLAYTISAYFCKKFSHLDKEEIDQEALAALWEAISKNKHKGFYIRGRILQFINYKSTIVKMPSHNTDVAVLKTCVNCNSLSWDSKEDNSSYKESLLGITPDFSNSIADSEILDNILSKLSVEYQTLAYCFWVKEWSQKKIAEIFGVSQITISRKLKHLRYKLRILGTCYTLNKDN